MPMHDGNLIVPSLTLRGVVTLATAYAVVTFAACTALFLRWCRSVSRAR